MIKTRWPLLGLVAALVLAVPLLTACEGVLGASDSGADANAPSQTAEPINTLAQAEGVAGAFLDAWQAEDYAAMYGLISFRSRETTPQDDFVTTYEDVATEMTLDNISYTLGASLRQGDTVTISYDVTFNTSLLGQIVDQERIMRLVLDGEGWRVAWSSMDIFAELAGGAFMRREGVLPVRANIYDRNGNILVNQSGVAITVTVVQQDIPDLEECNALLTRVLRLNIEDLQAIYDSRAADWVTTVGEIDTETLEAEQEALVESCNAAFEQRPTRRYLAGGLAPHVIGYVGYPTPEMRGEIAARGIPQDALVGISGVERAYDEELTGRPGGLLRIFSPNGQVLRTLAEVAPQRSESVYLTIDSDLQWSVQQALSDAFNVGNWAAGSGGAAAVVMDVNTGEILAMASYPSFDPNLFNPDRSRADAEERLQDLVTDPRQPQINRATQGQYPLGSVFKIITMIAAADSGVYDLDHRYFCDGTWTDGTFLRSDWLPGGHGALTLPMALTGSCNPYFYQTGFDLDQNDSNLLPNYAFRLGFGALTGIRGVEEEAGFIPSPETLRTVYGRIWNRADAVNMAIGQGEVQVTPLQVTRLVAAVANGGTLYVPQLVQRVQLLGEEPSYVLQPVSDRTTGVNPAVLEAVRGAMCQVTTNTSLGTAAYIFGDSGGLPASPIRACGKTGTAQSGGEGTRPHAWFASFAPPEDPQIAMVVIVESSREGSEVAAPIVRRVLEQYFGEVPGPYAPAWWPPGWWEGDYQTLELPGA